MNAQTLAIEKNEVTDNTITAVALGLLVVSLFLLWNEDILYSWFSGDQGNRPVVASVNPNQTDVRHKSYDDFSWFPLSKVATVLNDDSIFTGNRAEAFVTFTDGSRILLTQNSLVRLHMDEKTGAIQIDLQRGAVSIKTSAQSKFKIKRNKQSVENVMASENPNVLQRFQSDDHPSAPYQLIALGAPAVLTPIQITPMRNVAQVEPAKQHARVAKLRTKAKVKPAAQRAIAQVALPNPKPAPTPEEEKAQRMFTNITQANNLSSTSTPDDYPFEALARFAYLYSPGNPAIQGAISITGWLRQIYISKSEEARVRRIGLGADYNNSLVSPSSAVTRQALGITTLEGDLKYNLIYGSWYKDSVLGVQAGYQSLTFGYAQTGMVASGLYYGQMFPHFLDSAFNVLPFLRHRKWIEAQLKYYFMPTNSTFKSSGNYDFSLATKIFMKNNLFIFGALGYTNYNLYDTTQSLSSTFQAVYGTAGVGAQF